MLISSVARAAADPAAARTAANGIDAFGLELLAALLAGNGGELRQRNVVISPVSVALSLAMVRAGARGTTATQMDALLHSTGWSYLGTALNALDQALASRQAPMTTSEGPDQVLPVLQIANAPFAQRGAAIKGTYLDDIASAFGAGVRLVDYAGDPDGATETINKWVADATNGRIKDLLHPGDLSPDTLLALVNAVHFQAEWDDWFEAALTKPAPFTRPDGSRVSVPTMRRDAPVEASIFVIPYASGPGFQAVEISFKSTDSSSPMVMTLILPTDLAAFERSLTPAVLDGIVAKLASDRNAFRTHVPCPARLSSALWCYPYDLTLYLPRFGATTRADLIPVLRSLGMTNAFDAATADFSGITDAPFSLGLVIHQANITVDEKGAEAAAATISGGYGGTCPCPEPLRKVTIRFDHPFLFFLRDLATGAIVFEGQVTDPLAKG